MFIGRLHGLDVDATLARTPGPHLLVFTSPGCGSCRALTRALDAMEPIEGLALWEIAAGDAPGLVEELDVFHLPALFLFRDGELHRPVSAPPAAPRLRDAIRAALDAPALP
jgi:hypothetical protein